MPAEVEDGLEGPVKPSSPKELYNALYASCASQAPGKIFSQEDLLSLNLIPRENLQDLSDCLNRLCRDGLFRVHNKGGAMCWKVVKKEDAAKYQDLSIEEALVFSYIESSGREGIWTKTIRSRTNLHLIVMNRCLKSLEHKVFIKPIQSAKFPKRKIYILAHLQPSDDVTGGPFYTDGTLDEEFVHQLGLWVEGYVLKRSWHHPTTKTLHRKKGKSKLPHEDVNQPGSREHRDAAAESAKAVLPMPPGFTGYPTIPQITQAINESGLSGVVMKESEIRQLVDVLCWDGRMMKAMGSKGYKAVRQAASDDREHVENALTEAPCGKCPVFDLCEESGPVNAKTCEYFQDWLAL